MHYKDGTEAKVRDVVYGQSYNTPYPVTGVVVGLTPDMESCNLRVAFLKPYEQSDYDTRLLGLIDSSDKPPVMVLPAIDHGETKAFELVHRPGV